MARQKGIIKLKGKIGDISFYKTKDGYLAREKGGIEADRIKNDPAFARTRENGAEFGVAAKAGKLLRDGLRPFLQVAGDKRITSRLTKKMTEIKKYDATNERGKRTVGTGIQTPLGIAALQGFNFNNKSVLNSVLFATVNYDNANHEVSITDLVPVNDFNNPSGATHISINMGVLELDFDNGEQEFTAGTAQILPIDGTQTTVTLAVTPPGAITTNKVAVLLIEFLQEVNGNLYSLKNGAYNVLNILQID